MTTSERLTTWRTWLGKGTDTRIRRSPLRRSGRLAVESLERREMMAANLAADTGVAIDPGPNVDANPVLDTTQSALIGITKKELILEGYTCGRVKGVEGFVCTKGERIYWCDDSGKCESIKAPTQPGGVVPDVLPDEIDKGTQTLRGDLNGDGKVGDKDIDLLYFELRTTTPNPAFDLTGDGQLTSADKDELIENVLGTTYGDSNLDKIFNSSDLVKVFQIGEYEDAIDGNSGWAEGDWNGDGDFGSGDFVLAFEQGDFLAAASPGAASDRVGATTPELTEVAQTSQHGQPVDTSPASHANHRADAKVAIETLTKSHPMVFPHQSLFETVPDDIGSDGILASAAADRAFADEVEAFWDQLV